MTVGINELLIACGSILMLWIFNNVKLREGITEWFVSRLGIDNYNINNHNVLTSLRSLSFEAKTVELDNQLKFELYEFYVNAVLNAMSELVTEILAKEKKLSFEETKRLIKNTTYDKLNQITKEVKETIKMPNQLQDKFDKFCNYLALQHTYSIEHALQSSNKKLLLIQVLDAIDTNSRWFLFYTSELFDNFNGAFKTLTRSEVFIKKKKS